ncbi:MAG: virulence-associated E family protein [Eubacterium sp.]
MEETKKKTEQMVENEKTLMIAVGNSRTSKNWKNKKMVWSDLVTKLRHTTRTPESVTDYQKMSVTEKATVKDVGGFVGGTLKKGRRKAENVANRQLLTLDLDYANMDIWDTIKEEIASTALIYSTHSHTTDKPRFRLLIPLDRPVLPEEYQAIGRSIANRIGIDMFDDTTYEPSRLMYWPSTPCDGDYVFQIQESDWLSADAVLLEYPDWKDISFWPESSRSKAHMTRALQRQEDPEVKHGIVGAFCRTYSITEVIEAFLGDVYASCDSPDRYTFLQGSTSGGIVVYEDKFSYSHHGTDPASMLLCNAFDLVRVHLFGYLDEDLPDSTRANQIPSYKAMSRFATEDGKVKKQLAKEREASAREDFEEPVSMDEDWRERLEVDKQGCVVKSLNNLLMILQFDENLKNIRFNELSDDIEVTGKLPWSRPRMSAVWRDADDAQLIAYVTKNHSEFPKTYYDVAVTKEMDDRSYHPVLEYLNDLPEWDGVERADKLFIDCLNAEDNAYVRAVTRKTLCAAIARVKEPGCKFDTMLVLCGTQGIGKSSLIKKLSKGWFSDSLRLTDTKDKTAAEKIQRCWIIEIGELAGMGKTDSEVLKSFLSSDNDRYRASFGRRVTPHPRQCVFFGTSNALDGYLRDETGGRRFWPITVKGEMGVVPWSLTDEEVDQIWAEAMMMYTKGEELYLSGELLSIGKDEQRRALESDPREYMVREYLDTKVPVNWNVMSKDERIMFLDGFSEEEALFPMDRTCYGAVWNECFRHMNAAKITPNDRKMIERILTKIGWEKLDTPKKFGKGYGSIVAFQRPKDA